MRQFALWAGVMLAAMMLAGCVTARKYNFDISVKNDTDGPVTIWLTKDGPPEEKGWRSPEQVAITAPAHEERIGGMPVPPGKTAFTGPISGEFDPGTFPWLRIYDGKYASFSDLLAVSKGNPRRVDYALDPGKNNLVVRKKGAGLVVESETPEPASPAPAVPAKP